MSDLPVLQNPYIVIQTTQAPYSTSDATDSLEAALAATNIGMQVVYIFVGDGVYQLLKAQQSTLISHKSIYKKLSALPMFDVELIFAQTSALTTYHISLNDISFAVSPISDAQLVQICAKATQVLVF
ncbi:tRNA 2-thiouridine synthesizing protein C [Glaciecola punicea ACAM 611]|jgi:tRNA 2-thiouridine synthesizing protein C|uniref:tRNA 2-thiouridine synthesizing protein C n=1 Tax=Glaciecola punicea ACAM 611 TaxID=1121923 RepID=H5T9Q9_9ALTE|nr:DsrE family protein [Glaciecola punicea]OFA33337.1 hypothetical protein BAE46_01105 [Glaciecola punicea]GAB55036.1 tRNA 2-thiouridine synthesizing protein C [Glaciecola punicea ACAM 611]